MCATINPMGFYPDHDETPYLSWYNGQFSSTFVALNPFLNIPAFQAPPYDGPYISERANITAKKRGHESGVSWDHVAKLCGFSSIAHVNRALRMTGSARILEKFANPKDTALLLKCCAEQNLFLPDEGVLSPLAELSLERLFTALGHDHIMMCDYFERSTIRYSTSRLAHPSFSAGQQIHADDNSIAVCVYPDYHYFLVSQTDASRAKANPADYLEGFFADETTNDFWGIGTLGPR